MLALVLIAVAAGAEPARHVGDSEGHVRLIVRVTDHAQTDRLVRAKEYAVLVFASVGVSLSWEDSPGGFCGLRLFLARTSPGGGAMGRAVVADGQAWVFPNRISVLAAQKNLDEHVLLGRAIVHELGHLLRLRHARNGVMRAELYTDAMEAQFAFSPDEAAAIRSEIDHRAMARPQALPRLQ